MEMIDALTNFVTEIGAQGAFQESLEPQSPNDFPETASGEVLKAFLPFDIRLEERLAALQTYIDSLAEIFPELEKPGFRTEVIRDPDWGEAWKKYFKPLRVSRNIVIKPTWERFSPTGRDIVIEIDPGMAFGTGQHPSTRMCLEAIEEILLRDRSVDQWRVLDVGTGTGILGIACAKLDAEKVLCVDNDKKAAEIAAGKRPDQPGGRPRRDPDRDVATLTEPFHLIVANMTAKILIKLRSHLIRLLRPGGYLVISGIIEQNKPDIEAHFPGRFLSGPPPHHRKGVALLRPEERGRPAVTIPRLYLPRPLETGAVCAAAADQARYLKTVLRMREGDPLLIFNGTGWEYEAVIRRQTAEGMELEITGRRRLPAAGIHDHPLPGRPQGGKDGRDHPARDGTGRGADHPLLRGAVRPPLAAGTAPAQEGEVAEDRRRGLPPVRPVRHPGDRGDRDVRADASRTFPKAVSG